MNREAIYEAIKGQLLTLMDPPNVLGVQEVSRAFKLWEDATLQPAIYVVQSRETGSGQRGLPTKWTLNVDVWVYAKKEGEILGVQKLNPILDAIEAKFKPTSPPQNFVNTLGGLVVGCYISGTVEINGGYLGDQAVALIPLTVVTA